MNAVEEEPLKDTVKDLTGRAKAVGTAAWEAICGEMQQEFARGQFERGAVLGVRAISDLLAAHFPPLGDKSNELPDKPVVL